MSNVVYLEKTDIGATLTTWVYCAMWQLYAAEMTGRQGYIHWPKDRSRALQPYWDEDMFSLKPNMFDWYFRQPVVVSPSPREESEVWTWESNQQEVGDHSLMSKGASFIRDYFKRRCYFNDEVRRRGEALVERYRIDFKNTIGVTWRGTDCVTDGRPYLPIEVYFPFLDDILEARPSLRIVATAEEEGVLDPLLVRYPNSVVVGEFVSVPRGSPHNPERFGPASGYERGMQPALMVWLFSQCAYYVKNRSSTGLVASWLSDGKIVCLAHPEDGGYGFDITKAEVEGQIVPLYR